MRPRLPTMLAPGRSTAEWILLAAPINVVEAATLPHPMTGVCHRWRERAR